jgi:glycosyltransferase involved in cell wall biosynthesis
MAASVLHTITGLNVGGAEVMLARFLGELDRNSFSSTVLSLLAPGPLGARIEQSNSKVISIGMANRPKPLDLVRLTKSVSRATPDLLHGWMYHGNLAASIGSLATFRFAPVIWSIHHTLEDISVEKRPTQRLIYILSWLSSHVDAICYCSQVAATQHERLGFSPKRRRIIPNGVDCDEFRPSEEARTKLSQLLGIPRERKIVGNVARDHPMKDHANLVRAIAELVRSGYDVQGVIIGVGEENDNISQVARDQGISSRISTFGTRLDIPTLVPGFDVFALSSWSEAFPLGIAEAMASGVPVVTTAVGDCPWIVGDTGKVVPPRDSKALAAALAEMLELSGEARRDLGMRARHRVIDNFSLSQYVRRHVELYEEILSRRASQRNPTRSGAAAARMSSGGTRLP